MVSLVIVVTDILRQTLRQISGACELIAIEEFILECSPEMLYEYVVRRTSPAVHADADAAAL